LPAFLDPFFIAGMVTAVFGLTYGLSFAYKVWGRYSAAPPEIRQPLAYAIMSLANGRQVLAMVLPVLALLLIVGLRLGLVLAGN
jgi:cell division protein FtsX